MAKCLDNKYLPMGRVQKIRLIGCGGTGAILAEHLARMISGYRLETQPLNTQLVLMDGDVVGPENIIRQNFPPLDIGLNKAESLAYRLNAQFGLKIAAIPEYFEPKNNTNGEFAISCTDSLSSRKEVAKWCNGLWLDAGNDKEHGQVIIGNTHVGSQLQKEYENWNKGQVVKYLPNAAALNSRILKPGKEKKQPGCASMPFAQQGFGINAMAALAAAAICKQVLVDGMVKTQAIYFNVASGRMLPRLIDKDLYKQWKKI